MSLILVLVPTSLLGLLAIALLMIPRVSFAQETASTITGATTKAAYATATLPVFMGLSAEEWQAIGVIGGLVLGAMTWLGNNIINWYFRREHLKLAKRQAAAGKPLPADD